MNKRVVITGMGVISPVGNDVNTFWSNLCDGVCGIDYIKSFPTDNLPVGIAGIIKDFKAEEYGMDKPFIRKQDLFTQYGVAAAYQAMRQSGLSSKGEDKNIDPFRLGVYFGSGIVGFANAKALSRATDPNYASLPFNGNRAGFVMADGSAALVLEEYEHAKARGAQIIGEMVGYGNTCDAYHSTAPRPDGTTQAKCIELALEEAGFDKEKDNLYINAHGTGTKLNDVAETLAYKNALGDFAYKAHISSIKSMTGHMFGAAGAAEAIATVLALRDGICPPTINLDTPDPECDLDYTPNKAVKTDLTLGISDSFGFGGHDACVAFRKCSE